MGALDIFKAKENKNLKDKLQLKDKEVEELKIQLNREIKENERLEKEVEKVKTLFGCQGEELIDITKKLEELEKKKAGLEKYISDLNTQKQEINSNIENLKSKLVVLNEDVLLQDFGLYQPIYCFANSKLYKDKLEEIRNRQKELIKSKKAVAFYDGWTVNGSKSEGKKMTNNIIKQILLTFNTECESVIDKVKFNNIDNMRKRIQKTYISLNKLNETSQVALTSEYFNLKIEELNLAHEYQLKRQEEKEEQKRIREELREEAKLQREIEEARKNIYKDQKHFKKAYEKINEQLKSTEISEEQRQLLLEKRIELETQLNDLEIQLKDIDYRQSNQRAGYVYIISNIGAFGENVYKIGMTRRLDPQDRVDELGDASVPFNFDVHAMIFSEDAPKLENALHKAFEHKKVNMINHRREFFNTTLEEIEEVVKDNFDKTVEFIKIPQAEQYRESQKIKSTLNEEK